MLLPQDIIAKKRDGGRLSQENIDAFIDGVVSGDFTDYQSAALLMAIFLNGMSDEETHFLTQAMIHSGDQVDLQQIAGVKVDKHSTGGVGDKVSLILAPLAAACGVVVPMMSGRGLGHTGGTLDKLESIPGFDINLSQQRFKEILAQVGCAMIGQTNNIAPADKKLYALRDVTATVESIPLICSSIMSKKLAEGIDALILDVKVGQGAFMKTPEHARQLAKALVYTGTAMGKPTIALLSDMNEPLGRSVGNTLEVKEAIECLKQQGDPNLLTLSIELTAWMVALAKIKGNLAESIEYVTKILASGKPLEKLSQLVKLQGGNPAVVENPGLLASATHQQSIFYQPSATEPANGYLTQVDAMAIAKASLILGAGRRSMVDIIDPTVGISDILKKGDAIRPGERLCTIHFNCESKKDQAMGYLQHAFKITEKPCLKTAILIETLR